MNRHSTLVHILNHVVAPYLRQFFREQWNILYHTPWGDDANSLQRLLNVEKNRPTIKSLNNSGDSESWDLTALFSLLLFSDSVGKHLLNSSAHAAIDSLRNVRNTASHVSNSLLMNENTFKTRCKEIKRCLKVLGYQKAEDEIDDIIHERLLYVGFGATIKSYMKIRKLRHLIGIIILASSIVTTLILRYYIPCEKESDQLNHPNFYFPKELIPKDFEGREQEAAQLIEYIKYSETPLTCLDGGVGVGKTSLALNVGLKLMYEGYSVAYSKFNRSKSLLSSLQTISRSMGLFYTPQDTSFSSELEHVQEHIKNVLAKDIILIFDDVDNLLEVNFDCTYQLLHELSAIKNLKIIIITTSFFHMYDKIQVPVIHLKNSSSFCFPKELIPKHFTGRKHEIAFLTKSILNNKATTINIRGHMGLGKTSLSLKVGL